MAFATIFEGYSTKPVSFKLQRKVFHHKTVPFCLMIFQQAMLMKLYKYELLLGFRVKCTAPPSHEQYLILNKDKVSY